MIKLISDILARAHKTPSVDLSEEETCTECGTRLGYPKSLDIHHPKRLGNYVEGGGQSCPSCARMFMKLPLQNFSEHTDSYH